MDEEKVVECVETGRNSAETAAPVLEDRRSNGDIEEGLNPASSLEKFCGPKRLVAMAAWMNMVDDALVRLEKDVKDLIENQTNQAALLLDLERRKKEAIKEKAALEAAVLKDLKRVRVAEETAMARKRLQSAGIAQEEIDAILPVISHVE
ncbi:hypothetical protein PHPALM_29021 [Phytophthora palmivora]|uniref:Uncharacterized protein n=1 Tax=Phytophthora palmivora TaxID=4796 RepID=A0A2P4X8L4_9STRA|nr:hypothetical protein PHPALM_29021 [Phytophthora palmivora]